MRSLGTHILRMSSSVGLESASSGWSESQENSVSKEDILQEIRKFSAFVEHWYDRRPFASSPAQSPPRRTYDPSYTRPYSYVGSYSQYDPEGRYLPMYLANLYRGDSDHWISFKHYLDIFGKVSGLFDEITINSFGKTSADPFQIQVRKSKGKNKGPWRNLVDIGYGVSQVLPVLAGLMRIDLPPIFLLQQPEVHLHPSAQAALGSLFCAVAGKDKQLILETHSDYIIDRVRIGVRDSDVDLIPDDVSILFFERVGLDVKIHSLKIDEQGNVVDAPKGYRQFFIDELDRSLGF